MTTRFTFSRTADGGLTAPAATKAGLAAAYRANHGSLSREIVNAAAADLQRETRDLMFTSKRDYETCARHAMARDPWLALATALIGDDRADRELGIEIVGGTEE